MLTPLTVEVYNTAQEVVMVITFDLPDKLNRKVEADQRRFGLSRSQVLRQIIAEHYERKKDEKRSAA